MPVTDVRSPGQVVATTTIQMDFRSDPGVVSRTRQYIAGLYAHLAHDEDVAERVSMVVHELLENVAKYGTSGQGMLEVRLHVDESQVSFRVRTRNDTSGERLARLRETLDALHVHADPAQFYDDAIAHSATLQTPESGLGLARVRAEAGMQLSYSLEGNCVTIDAEWSGTTPC